MEHAIKITKGRDTNGNTTLTAISGTNKVGEQRCFGTGFEQQVKAICWKLCAKIAKEYQWDVSLSGEIGQHSDNEFFQMISISINDVYLDKN